MKLLTLFFLVCISSIAIADSNAPPLPYEDPGACPFECCTYRQWTVNADTTFHATRDTDSAAVYTAHKGEIVRGITGVVVTTKPGKAITKKTVTLDPDHPVIIPAGSTFYVLHYEGEGISKFWYNGKTYSDELPLPKEENDSMTAEGEPESVWWVQVENAKKLTGWSNETEHFDHMDSCE